MNKMFAILIITYTLLSGCVLSDVSPYHTATKYYPAPAVSLESPIQHPIYGLATLEDRNKYYPMRLLWIRADTGEWHIVNISHQTIK